MKKGNNYIIEGGAEGKKRLHVLSEILSEYTRQLLLREGSIEGQSVLDVGSGSGDVAIMAAGLVGQSGSVTAVDFDRDIITLAEQDTEVKGISNIRYIAQDVHNLDYSGLFDIVYARFLLSHLQDPVRVLHKLMESLKPGGRIIIEDIDFSGHFCYPPSKAFDDYLHYFATAAGNNGHNAHIGLSLFSMFTGAGVKDVQFDVIQPCFNKGQGKWMAYYTMDRIRAALLKQDLATESEMEQTLAKLKAFTEDESTIISLPRVFRVWGRRP